MEIEEALKYATDTECFESGDVLENIAPVYSRLFGKEHAVIIADENTYKAAGNSVSRLLLDGGIECREPVLFPGDPILDSDYRYIEVIARKIQELKAVPVAVGSGTINDLVKTAAFERGRPYIAVATAASVDGYTSPGSSVVKNGFKNSMQTMHYELLCTRRPPANSSCRRRCGSPVENTYGVQIYRVVPKTVKFHRCAIANIVLILLPVCIPTCCTPSR